MICHTTAPWATRGHVQAEYSLLIVVILSMAVFAFVQVVAPHVYALVR